MKNTERTVCTVRYLNHIPENALHLYFSLLRDARNEFADALPRDRHMPAVYVLEYDTNNNAGEAWSEEFFSDLTP